MSDYECFNRELAEEANIETMEEDQRQEELRQQILQQNKLNVEESKIPYAERLIRSFK